MMNKASRPAASDPRNGSSTRATLLASVEEIHDVLAAQCEAEEAQRTLSTESVEALYDAGIFSMKLPACLGGAEADLVTQFEVIEAVTIANASAGWCTMVGATSLGMPGAFLPDEGVDRMFGGDRLPLGAITIMPAGVATPVDGGYRLSGRWSFASGVRHAEWITAMARRPRSDIEPPDILMTVFPAAEARLYDNWHVAGLKGTGSCDFSVDDLFVPEAMSWNVAEDGPRRGGPLYTLGIPAFVAYEHAAFPLGVARRSLDALIDVAGSKSRGYGPGASKLARRATVQRLIGRSELALGAARALTVDLNERVYRTACAGDVVTPQLHARLRGAATYCTEVATEVTTEAFRYSGAAAVYEQSVLQRGLRDINVAAQHLMASDASYENIGQFALGMPDATPMG